MDLSVLIFQFVVLIFSVMIHEISHGLMAERLGDPTARMSGRITLNPVSHIDLFGSILLPLALVLTGSPVVIGWAKPVPYNPYLTRNPKTAGGKIAAAGPLSNFFLAIIFAALFRVAWTGGMQGLAATFAVVVVVNLALGVFNLLPIPPLDGSKVLFALLPENSAMHRAADLLERYGIILIFLLLWVGGSLLGPVIGYLFRLLTGINF